MAAMKTLHTAYRTDVGHSGDTQHAKDMQGNIWDIPRDMQ